MAPNPIEDAMSKADKNNDGTISRDEFTDAMNGLFIALDKNGDGVLDKDEMAALRPGGGQPGIVPAALMKQRDTNGDGKLTLEESGMQENRFKALDTNGDGFVTLDELQAGMNMLRGAAGRRGGGPAGPADVGIPDPNGNPPAGGAPANAPAAGAPANAPAAGAPGAAPAAGAPGNAPAGAAPANAPAAGAAGQQLSPAQRAQRFMDRWDTNKDGKITKDEFKGAPAVFQAMDLNGDGVLTLDEIEKGQATAGGRGGQGAGAGAGAGAGNGARVGGRLRNGQ
jgi:Ca2+-binding EF-hand superfamily protein